jgi:hypothetical protein
MALRRPVVQVECWATVPGSDKLPWRMAGNLADQVRLACYDRGYTSPRPLVLPDGYPVAWVRSVKPLTHPRRIWSDQGDYAGFALDLYFTWISQTENLP